MNRVGDLSTTNKNDDKGQIEMVEVKTDEPNNEEIDAEIEVKIHEKWYHILREIFAPFIFAGAGLIGAGVLFDSVEKTEVFRSVKSITALVPTLLGLKGNLEMTLASRLSTQVNLGIINDRKTITRSVLGNRVLTQLQSIVVGILASVVAGVFGLILGHAFEWESFPILIGSSVGTASFASLILGTIITIIILVSKKFKFNPDNVATPIAASLGDLLTLGLLYGYGTFLYITRDKVWINYTILGIFVLLIPFFAYYCYKNEFVKEPLIHGWAPVVVAMFLQSIAGLILEISIERYPSITIYQPVVNGLGGNLVAVYASRLSTSLHKTSKMGSWASWSPQKYYQYPIDNFFRNKNLEQTSSRVLMGLTAPSHLAFFFIIYFIDLIYDKDKYLSVSLVIFYVIIVVVQVYILLVMAYFLVHVAWRFKIDPDNTTIPLLTAAGDLLGTALLFLAFELTYLTGNNAIIDTHTTTTTMLTSEFVNNTTPIDMINSSQVYF